MRTMLECSALQIQPVEHKGVISVPLIQSNPLNHSSCGCDVWSVLFAVVEGAVRQIWMSVAAASLPTFRDPPVQIK